MLYLSSRSKTDSFTSNRALHEPCAPDGGCFIPFRLPFVDEAAIGQLSGRSFGENVAQALNLFFSTAITGWDVDCVIGRNAATVTSMSRRVVIARLWNNPQANYSYLVDQLYHRISDNNGKKAGSWPRIAIRIAVLFGLTGELSKVGVERFDIAAAAGDFELPMAAWYARKMGLPVGTIICACNENSVCWDLLHKGEMDTGAAVVNTATPELDVQNPSELERLIYGVLGTDETCRYLEATTAKRTYYLNPVLLPKVNHGLFVSVVGQKRVEPVINSVYRTGGIVLDPYTAVSYGGLQDYRAKTGESKPTLLISDRSPLHFIETVTRATGLTKDELRKHI